MRGDPLLHSIISNLPSWPRQEARELRRLLQAVYGDGMDKMSEGRKIDLVKVVLSLTEFGNRPVLWPLTES